VISGCFHRRGSSLRALAVVSGSPLRRFATAPSGRGSVFWVLQPAGEAGACACCSAEIFCLYASLSLFKGRVRGKVCQSPLKSFGPALPGRAHGRSRTGTGVQGNGYGRVWSTENDAFYLQRHAAAVVTGTDVLHPRERARCSSSGKNARSFRQHLPRTRGDLMKSHPGLFSMSGLL